MSRLSFPQAELDRVPDAIKRAEAKTSAEIFAVLARRSDDYRFVAYSFCALWIFLFSGLIALWIIWSDGGTTAWSVDDSISYPAIQLAGFILAQIGSFVLIVLVMRLVPSLPVKIAPERIKRERARANGIGQFLAHGVDRTSGRSGILVFVSLDERYAEIYCDHAIETALGREFFLDQVKVLVGLCAKGSVIEGYVSVIESIGERLEAAFPIAESDVNELENRFVILP